MKRCKLCGKDLTPAVELLGVHAVNEVHKAAHLNGAIRGLLIASNQWPELEQHFEPLRKAFETQNVFEPA